MSQVFTGSKASLKINGKKIMFASSVTVNEDNTLTDIDVLDQLQVAELAETGHKVNCTINLFKVDKKAVKQVLGLDAINNINSLLSQPDGVTIDIVNGETHAVEYTMTECKFAGGSGTVDARGVWTGTWNFRGVRGGPGPGGGGL